MIRLASTDLQSGYSGHDYSVYRVPSMQTGLMPGRLRAAFLQ
jgi:hypothetical protein